MQSGELLTCPHRPCLQRPNPARPAVTNEGGERETLVVAPAAPCSKGPAAASWPPPPCPGVVSTQSCGCCSSIGDQAAMRNNGTARSCTCTPFYLPGYLLFSAGWMISLVRNSENKSQHNTTTGTVAAHCSLLQD